MPSEGNTEILERLLIHENGAAVISTTNDAEDRAALLNRIIEMGIAADQVDQITRSTASIGEYIYARQLQDNKKLRELVAAGIKGVEAELPTELENLKYVLTTASQRPNKTQFLKFTDRWEVDRDSLEKYFVLNRLKFYVHGEQLEDYKELLKICAYFTKQRMPNNQLRESSFLWSRIEPVAADTYIPRASYFWSDRYQRYAQ